MVSSLQVKAAAHGREIVNITPESAGWKQLGFRAVRLAPEETETVDTGTRELCLVVLTGRVDISVNGQIFPDLGTRNSPPQGFAFQRVYTDKRDIDEACAVEDHDLVMVPRGYHPVVAPHGYDLYYLKVMAGPQRLWVFKNDPQHEWMLQQPAPAPVLSGSES